MKKTRFLSVIVLTMFVFAACSKVNDPSPAQENNNVSLKTLIITPCGGPQEHNLWAGTVENHPIVGKFTISNDNGFLYLNLVADYGFQAIDNNVDIAIYNTLPVVRPDVEGFHYKFTVASGNTLSLAMPLNEIYFEDLGSFSTLSCNQQFFILVHSDVMMQGLTSTDIIAGSGWAGSILGPDGQWWKWIPYTICCTPECTSETAWAWGTRYVNKGEWASYTSYTGLAKTETLFAGQTKEAGTVYFTPNGNNVDIRIELNEGWSLQDVKEAVKIQGYISAPVTKPSPGLFTTYKGNNLSVTVPNYNFYGIHVDVQHCK